jgi:hypothetical protein
MPLVELNDVMNNIEFIDKFKNNVIIGGGGSGS